MATIISVSATVVSLIFTIINIVLSNRYNNFNKLRVRYDMLNSKIFKHDEAISLIKRLINFENDYMVKHFDEMFDSYAGSFEDKASLIKNSTYNNLITVLEQIDAGTDLNDDMEQLLCKVVHGKEELLSQLWKIEDKILPK